jgi:MoaA/NifB/PqqE/SkfB family radical SAM enzyme
MVKYCEEHGVHRYVIENDYEFIKNLNCSYKRYHFNNHVMFEISDKCNLDCPHCYHIPNNKIKDPSIDILMNQIKKVDREIRAHSNSDWNLCLAGAESSMHENFHELLQEIKNYNKNIYIQCMTNGVRFAKKDFTKKSKQAGLHANLIGLNHPSYIGNSTIRKKQEEAIDNCKNEKIIIGYISYTMSTLQEMEDILTEITTKHWTPHHFRIRYGSDIGRNIGQERLYLSDIFKLFQQWCKNNNQYFELLEDFDNNIYHIMVRVGKHTIRLIQWCDEYDIDMENLISGPWSWFVHGGITNFLNQIIRRNAFKNKGIFLQDKPPLRYQMQLFPTKTKLDLRNLE